jgi:hypothetical protein
MMGDEDQDPITIDDTEIYLMKAFLHFMSGVIYTIVTYDINVPYYDFIAGFDENYSWDWLSQSSNLLTIRADKGNSLASAHAELNSVLDSIESAWEHLKNDEEYEYDVILLEDVTEAVGEFDKEVAEAIAEARSVLNDKYTVTIDFGDCEGEWVGDTYFEECTENEKDISINLEGFMTSPPQNIKNIFPAYTIENGSCEYDDWDEETGEYTTETVSCPALKWSATTCNTWKSGWDVTFGGMFPDMTTTLFFDDIIGLDTESCDEILSGGAVDF